MARRTLATATLLAWMAMAALSCGGPAPRRDPAATTAHPRPPPAPSAQPPLTSPASTIVAARPADSAGAPAPTGSAVTHARQVGGDPCRLTRGPIQLSFTGQPVVWFAAGEAEPHVVFNRDGAPHPVTLPAAIPAPAASASPASPTSPIAGPAPKVSAAKPSAEPAPARPDRLALAEPAERASAPGCVTAGASLFCADHEGALHRSQLGGEASSVVARGRPGAPIAAATIAGAHVVYAFLADRKTSEGATTLAFVALDDAAPSLLSEDGSGATFVTLGARGGDVVAVYVDARRALTPIHARVLTARPALGVGPDAVVFVGEGTEGRTAATLVQGPAGEFALFPIFKDVRTFGMAAIRIDEQPRDDAPVVWSLYPGGLDRPSIAASRGLAPARVLRGRPASADPKAPQILELGDLAATGEFSSRCAVAEGSTFADLSVTADPMGGVWLTYTDATGTWIERRGAGR